MSTHPLLSFGSLCLLLLQNQAPEQHTKQLVYTLDRGDYIYIPPAAFAAQTQEVLYQEKSSYKPTHQQMPIEFSWYSICTDGSYRLTITPEQVYFTDGHNNPNPNHIYWAITIDWHRYEAVKRAILRHPPAGFSNLSTAYKGSLLAYKDKSSDLVSVPSGWSDKKYASYCIAQRNRQLTRLFILINSSFKNPQSAIHRPGKDTPKPFNYDVQGVLNRLPDVSK